MPDRRRRQGPSRARGDDREGVAAASLDPQRTVYGRHPVREAARGRRKILALHLTEGAERELGELVQRLASEGVRVQRRADARALDELAGTSDHQGAVAEVEGFPYVSVEQLLSSATRAGTAPLVFCLDQVTDPHNLGAIARVVDASGATGMIVPEHRSAHVTAAAVKASAGALEHVLVARCTNLADTIERTKGPDIWAYAATERGRPAYTEVDLAGGVLLVLGAEGPGIRPRVLSACDEEVRIPMAGAVASLNVATVSAVLAFEAARQRSVLAQSEADA